MAGFTNLPLPLRPGESAARTTDGGQMRATLNKLWSALVILAVLGVAHADQPVPVYTVKPGDTLSIAVWKEPDLTSNAVLVRPDGTFSFPLVGQVDARGKGVQELQN